MENMKQFGALASYRENGTSVSLVLEDGIAEIAGITEHIIRLRLTSGRTLEAFSSYAIEEDLPEKTLSVSDGGDTLSVSSGEAGLLIDKAVFSVSLTDANGTVISKGEPFSRTDENITDNRIPTPGEDFFGLGERVSPFGHRGHRVDNWNYPAHQRYLSLPFMIAADRTAKSFWGYFLDSSCRTMFELGTRKWDRLSLSVQKGEFTVYFITGDSAREIVERYTFLTGRHAMPPVWALGYHQCRWSYMSSKEADEAALIMREKKIPCDAFWYDIDYMDEYRVFTFNRERFGDVKEHFDRMKELNYKKVVIVDPGVKKDPEGVYDVYDEGLKNGYFMKSGIDDTVYEGNVWSEGIVFPDFTKPEVRTWWGNLHKRYFDAGVDAFWNDMNEPFDRSTDAMVVPEHVRLFDDNRWSTMDRMHNVYALFEAKATVEGMLNLRENDRPFLLTRAGYAGIQKYSAKWSGDNTSSWTHLMDSIPQMLNLGLSGLGFAGADVGGFCYYTTPELLARWTQLGIFYPFFRNHATRNTSYQEPWLFGDEIEAVCRKAIELRYHLLPYLYQLFYEMHTKGHPVMRPLFWSFPEDERAHNTADEFMFGDYMLAAPVVTSGATERLVYLPEGRWYHYETGTRYDGGKSFIVEAPLESIPLFVRDGAVIPVMDVVQSTEEIDPSVLMLEVFGNGSFNEKYYEDDMRTNAYRKGVFNFNDIIVENDALTVLLDAESSIQEITARLFKPVFNFIPAGFVQEEEMWYTRTVRNLRDVRILLRS
jgi:alpha-glucosidase